MNAPSPTATTINTAGAGEADLSAELGAAAAGISATMAVDLPLLG